jgi:uncharacterized UBP type Zn finger protein
MSPFVDAAASEDHDMFHPHAKRRHSEVEKVNEASDLIYELRGVLLHKGPSAYHGHYEAQVFDVTYVLIRWALNAAPLPWQTLT